MKHHFSFVRCLTLSSLFAGLATAACTGSDDSANPGAGGTGALGGAAGTGVGGSSGSSGAGAGGMSTGGAGGAGKGGSGGMSTGGTGGTGGGAGTGGGGGAGTGGAGGAGAGGASGGAGGAGGDAGTAGSSGSGGGTSEPFSFFVTSLVAMKELSGSADGFGGDLRFGQADGLSGADEICKQIAERSMPSNGKVWRAFLSVTKDASGNQVDAIDRIGEGPWYDRTGRLLAMTKEDLLEDRPNGADPEIINDLPNENGIPNKDPDGQGEQDCHATLTGTGPDGKLWSSGLEGTCQDWTSKEPTGGKPHVGYAWPAHGSFDWKSIFDEPGCAPGVVTVDSGGPNPDDPSVGSSGGYGAIYCFALTP